MDNSGELPGFPGYRTRDDRSGLDPIDTPAEAAHMEGTFYRNLFTLRLRTRDPFYLVLMFVFGVIPFSILLVVSVDALLHSAPSTWGTLICMSFITIPPGALTINFLINILEITRLRPRPKVRSAKSKPREKKMPRRRKDYR